MSHNNDLHSTRNTDVLIEDLAQQATQSSTFNARAILWSALLIIFIPLLGVIMAALGYRSDWSMTALAKPSVFFLLALCCVFQLIQLAKPIGAINTKALLLLPIAFGCFLLLFLAPPLTWAEAFGFKTYNFCFVWISGFGISVYFGLRFILHRARPAMPHIFGALLGFFSATLVASFYAMHCPQDAALYIVAAYLPALAIVTTVSALFPHKKWFW
jgi:hypothetical protein